MSGGDSSDFQFPASAGGDMSDQIGMLLVQIDIRDREIAKLSRENERMKDALDAIQDPTTAKIIDLAKKNRTLNVNSESLKTRVRKLELELKKATEQVAANAAAAASMSPTTASSSTTAATAMGNAGSISYSALAQKDRERTASSAASSDELAQEWKAKHDALFSRFNDLQLQAASAKNESAKLRMLLQKEIGDDTDIAKIAKEDSNWRGRAQQISLLKIKIEKLKRELASATGNGALRPDTASVLASDSVSMYGDSATVVTGVTTLTTGTTMTSGVRFEELERLKGECSAKDEELSQLKIKIDGYKSRITNLESYSGGLKSKIALLLNKTENDDKLITTLKEQVVQARRMVSNSSAGGAAPSSGNSKAAAILSAKATIDDLSSQIDQLRSQLTMLFASKTTYQTVNGLRQALYKAFEVQKKLVSSLVDLCGGLHLKGAVSLDEQSIEISNLKIALDTLTASRQEDLQLFGMLKKIEPSELEQMTSEEAEIVSAAVSSKEEDAKELEKENEQLKVEVNELKSRYNALMTKSALANRSKQTS
eukprot:ANDGO_07033.mRNA.1 hypothetical protein